MKDSKDKRSRVAISTIPLHAVNDKPKKRQHKIKVLKDPNLPKKPVSAFLVFMEEFRKTFKAENPDVKGVAAVGKAGGEIWKNMKPEEKAFYIAKASQRKDEYLKLLAAYVPRKPDLETTDDDVGEY